MRKMMGICVWIVVGTWIQSSWALSITGQVVDSKARAVQGAEVVVCERYWIGALDQDARMISPVARTDAEGRFSLDADATSPREVFIVARKAPLAYAWEWLNAGLNTLGRKHFPLVLEPACALTGQVVDPEGKPVAGAEVQAVTVNTWGFSGVIDRWTVVGPRPWFTVTTDAQSRFRFEQFAADVSAALRVQAPGSETRYAFRKHIMESCGFPTSGPDLRLVLPREGTIKGQVVDGQGRPVGGVDLMIRSGREREDITNLYIVRKARSDQAGTFVFKGIPEGPHGIEVLAPEREPPLWTGMESKVSVKAGAVAETTVRVDKGGVLEVTALDARTRRPLTGARLDASGQRSRHHQSAVTDAKAVACVRVPTDSYTVHVSAPGFSYCQSTVKVVEGQTVRREALLTPSPRVFGRVLDAKGQPAADVVVVVHPFGDHAYTDADGRFDAGCDKRRGAQGGLVVARDVKTGLAAAVSINGPSKAVSLKLGPAWTLTGKIADTNGAAIPAARVSLGMPMLGCLCDLGVEVLSDPQGRFEMKAIPPVQKGFDYYYVSANAAGYGPQDRLRTFLRGPPGASVDLGTVRLPPAGASVSGVVVDAKGVPAVRVPVFVNDEPGLYQPKRKTATNERGEFAITRLCPGPARLQANFGNSPGGATSVTTRLPAHGIRIVLGKDVTHTPEAPTPNMSSFRLTDLCPHLSRLQTDGRPILLCLVDPLQQPSRQCMIDLAKKADTLTAKGVITVVVLTTKVDAKQHDAFLKVNRISFPNRLAGDDFEARKAAWGIKSLPWLILTDKDHRVRAQGFPVDQLDGILAPSAEIKK